MASVLTNYLPDANIEVMFILILVNLIWIRGFFYLFFSLASNTNI
jgi:hypothetical protein